MGTVEVICCLILQATLANGAYAFMLRTVRATRYVTPLREGGSLPAIVEADDLGLYVLKFRGAGQGPLALVAELIGGEVGRALGLPIPELVFIEVDPALGRNEPDEEIRDLLQASIGLNLALDYLPGSITFDPAAGDTADADLASRAVWFDALITNVDRTAHNPNLLYWHKKLYFIDHGAALYFHHNWTTAERTATTRFPAIRDHVLLRWASKLEEVNAELRPRLTESLLRDLLAEVPAEWLLPRPDSEAPVDARAAYLNFFLRRLESSSAFVEEAHRAHAQLV